MSPSWRQREKTMEPMALALIAPMALGILMVALGVDMSDTEQEEKK